MKIRIILYLLRIFVYHILKRNIMSNITTIQDLENLKGELLERIKQVDITIDTLKSMSRSSDLVFGNNVKYNENKALLSGYEKFDTTTTFRNKVMFIIKQEDRFIHAREISGILNNLEPSDEDVVRKVSAALSLLKQKDLIGKIKINNANVNTFWGSKKWLDESGNPLDGHDYNKEYITKSSEEIIEI